jgi:hypothetical protein
MTLSDQQWEFLQDVARLIQFAKENGYKLTGGELKRPHEMQELYFANGKSKTMKSDHLNAMAIDFNIFYDYDNDGDKDFVGVMSKEDALKASEKLCEYWKSLNPLNYAGRDWGWDIPHLGRKRG